MSLRVWLPLTKDLRQQGLDSTTVTQNSGTTISSGGKLGSCLTATSNATVVVNLPSLATMLANGKSYSLACWVKVTNQVTNGWAIKLGDNSCGLWWAASEARWVWNENDGGKRCANPTVSSDTTNWHHLVTTITKSSNGSTTTARHYVDGEPATSYETQTWDGSGNTQPAGTTITISPYVASLNDIRLYDHCLSENEIKRLAQGLIVHYPLNNSGVGNENLYGYGSDCTSLSRLNQSTNKFTVITEDGYVCAHASGALQTTAYLQSQIPFTPKPLEYITFSAYVKIKNIVRGTTNPMCEFYFSGQTIDGTWRGVNYIKWTKDGVEVPHTAIGFDNTGSFNMNDNQWHYVTATVQFQNYNFTSDLRPSIYLRDCTGDMYIHHIKYERGQIATPWCENDYANLVYAANNDHTTYIEPDGTRWLRIFHHNNPASTLFASTDDFANGIYKDSNRWYRVESVCRLISKYEFMVKQKDTSDGTERKYRWIQSKSPLTAAYADVQPSVVTRITTSGYTDGTYGGLYKSATSKTRLTIADGTAGDWWGAIGCWSDYSGGIPGYPKIKVTTGYIDLYIRIDNLSFSKTEYDISGFGNNATSFVNQSYTTDTPKYVVSTIFQNGTTATVSPIFSSTTRHKQLTFATWIKHSSDDANYHYYWNNGGVQLGIRAYNNVNNYYWIAWTHATDSTYEDHGWVNTVMPKDTWIHVVWVFDSGIWKQYINGELNGTRNDSSTGTYIYGDVGAILGNSWVGNISDFRIYATALSTTDVKSLYQNCATIGPDGTIYGQIRS